MSSSVCQGLQSCLEPRLVEQRVLRLKLSPPASSFSRSFGLAQRPGSSTSDSREAHEKSHTEENNKNNKDKNNDKVVDDCNIKSQKNGELGGWSFIQALSNTSLSFKEVLDTDKVYVHPLVKRSSSMLSAKSLEMCTESLGSESGTGISQSSHEVSSPSWRNSEKFAVRELSEVQKTGMKNKMTRSTSFPPPLTSISSRGGGGLQVRPHREDGRLVIEAVAIPACHSYFHADRSDGRLRLQLLKDCFQNCNNEATKEEDDEQVVEEDGEVEADEEAVEGGGNEDESDETDGESAHWGEEEKEEEEEEEEMEVTGGNVAGEIELGKLPRPSRCMEGGGHTNNSLMNWESIWVATS